MAIVAHALDEHAEALLAFEQRPLGLAPLGDVAGDLGEAEQRAVVVADRIDDGLRPEARAVLADPPALGLEPALLGGGLQDARRAGPPRWSSSVKKAREMPADDLVGLIALEAPRARIPGRDMPGRLEHVDRIIGDGVDQQLEALLGDTRVELDANRP